ncbi:hypothetical protein [Thalassomonas actiniarum]|uniref:Uncharacterized protein n=1 Tax=Thalassomonas actiniarum TaxID=485447 RepID=A0AAE9YLA8_9GAMM|nr:hypothetical protein [Thalassomonas actiniarum]WDD97302.1 hypothetical protein SG35_018400 [Thalassomonas actiniarum]
MLNRRHFILAGTSGLMCSMITPGAMASSLLLPATPRQTPTGEQIPEDIKGQFARQINDRYLAWNPSGTMCIKLAEVKTGPVSPGLLQFDLTFNCHDTEKADGLYQIAHLKSDQQHQVYLEKIEESNNYRAVFCLFEGQT